MIAVSSTSESPLNGHGNGHDLGLDPLRAERRRRVNRRNARRSTGPRTPTGKLRSSRNAITHGIFAADPVVAGDDPQEYRAHRISLMRGLNPADALELEYAEQFVLASWKLKRAELAEVEHFQLRYEQAREQDPDATLSPGMLLEEMIAGEDPAAERFQRYQRRLQVMRDKALKHLESLKKEMKEGGRSPHCDQLLQYPDASVIWSDWEEQNEATTESADVTEAPMEAYSEPIEASPPKTGEELESLTTGDAEIEADEPDPTS